MGLNALRQLQSETRKAKALWTRPRNEIGSDEYLAGKAGGGYIAENGATNVLCVNTIPGAANLEARNAAAGDGHGVGSA